MTPWVLSAFVAAAIWAHGRGALDAGQMLTVAALAGGCASVWAIGKGGPFGWVAGAVLAVLAVWAWAGVS